MVDKFTIDVLSLHFKGLNFEPTLNTNIMLS